MKLVFMFQKYYDYAFVALDFDRTVISGHMHQYFMFLYLDKSPNEILAMYDQKSNDEFIKLLREIAIFAYLNDELNFVNNLTHPDRRELCDIFRSKDAILRLQAKYQKNFSEFQPFIAEPELKGFLEYRIQHDLPTAIVSNSMFYEMIKETLFVLLGEPNNIQVYTPDCDPAKSIRENVLKTLYVPHDDKNELLVAAKRDSRVLQGKMMFMDDERKNLASALRLGFETEDTPPIYNPFVRSLGSSNDTEYDEPFESRSPSPVGDLCITPPATIGGRVSAISSTAMSAGQITGADTCPLYAEGDSPRMLADMLDTMVANEQNKGLGRD